MIQIDLPTLVKRLNLFSRQALEMAASECMSQQAAEITVSHVLIQMLAMPRSDLRVITRQGDIGMEELRQALTVENYTTARSADSYPAFSPMLVEWLKEGWLLASATDHNLIQLLGIVMASTGSFSAMAIFWTTPDQSISLRARAIGIAVINATGNIGSALSPFMIGWLKDITGSFSSGLWFVAALLVIGAMIIWVIPMKGTRPRATP